MSNVVTVNSSSTGTCKSLTYQVIIHAKHYVAIHVFLFFLYIFLFIYIGLRVDTEQNASDEG